VERKNREVEQAKLALEEKATQLALSSKYKSEFLANMSHELRTPLNSLLILAQQLSDNPEGNLSGKQVEFAKTIHGSGSDLLTLINDILDLSKIESGTVTLDVSEYRFANLRNYVDRTFRHMAEAKHLGFTVDLAENLPTAVMTDTTRLQQVLKNLLSNAFKFTSHGQVALQHQPGHQRLDLDHPNLVHADAVLAFSVSDTGVGIASDKLQLIFEAFQQADGSTARKYGGTGLGLSISRELARLLGGEIRVESVVNAGSTFTLFLPYNRAGFINYDQARQPQPARLAPRRTPQVVYTPAAAGAGRGHHRSRGRAAPAWSNTPSMLDDRSLIAPGDPSVLIIEDDDRFAKTVLELRPREELQGIVTNRGDSALSLARDYLPSAILLDIDLPDIDGFTVLDRLKRDPSTRHIPVHVMSACASASARCARARSLTSTSRSAATCWKRNSRASRSSCWAASAAAGGGRRQAARIDRLPDRRRDLRIVTVETGQAALDALNASAFRLHGAGPDPARHQRLRPARPDRQGPALRDLPIVIYTAKELNRKEVTKLKKLRQDHRHQGCAFAGAPAGRDGAVPAPLARFAAGTAAPHAGGNPRGRRRPGRTQSADRRRRPAQHLRPVLAAGAPADAGAPSRRTAATASKCWRRTRPSRSS
jgi:CheY-like chemotaxis protein